MKIRPYMDHDWQSVLDICILAFTPIHQSFETLLGTDLFRLVYPDWKASHERYLRSLTNAEKDRPVCCRRERFRGRIHTL